MSQICPNLAFFMFLSAPAWKSTPPPVGAVVTTISYGYALPLPKRGERTSKISWLMSDQSRTGLRKSHDGQKALQQRPHVSLRASSFFSHEYTNKYKRNTQLKQNLKQELMKGTSFFFITIKAITITTLVNICCCCCIWAILCHLNIISGFCIVYYS